MNAIQLYYYPEPETDRWIRGDRYIRPLVRQLVRGKRPGGGIGKVFTNLCLGLDRLKIPYEVNHPYQLLKEGDHVGVLGRGRHCLDGYNRPNPIVAGIGLMTHPSEWPTLCSDYPVVCYLQHSDWANEVYKPYFGDRCRVWPVGIDTDYWAQTGAKTIDFLVYDKILWGHDKVSSEFVKKVLDVLEKRRLKFTLLKYGSYKESEYRELLAKSRAMLFLCEHESQGIAYQECLSSDVPILAWDFGEYLDPNRYKWGTPQVKATSVPYFDSRCGETFKELGDFDQSLSVFLERLRQKEFSPREYILENLTLEKCAQNFVEILREANSN